MKTPGPTPGQFLVHALEESRTYVSGYARPWVHRAQERTLISGLTEGDFTGPPGPPGGAAAGSICTEEEGHKWGKLMRAAQVVSAEMWGGDMV